MSILTQLDKPIVDRYFQRASDWLFRRSRHTNFALAAVALYTAVVLALVDMQLHFNLGSVFVVPLIFFLVRLGDDVAKEQPACLRKLDMGIAYINGFRVSPLMIALRVMLTIPIPYYVASAVYEMAESDYNNVLFLPVYLLTWAGMHFAACRPDKVPDGCRRI